MEKCELHPVRQSQVSGAQLNVAVHSGMTTRPNRVKTWEFLAVIGDTLVHLRPHPRHVYHAQKVSLAF